MRVMLFGTFDDLHPGHEYVFREALRRAEIGEQGPDSGVWAVVALDANVLRFKGHPPLQTQEERSAAINRLFPDVHVMLGDPSDFLAPIRSVHPDLILLGYDQKLPPGVHDDNLGVRVERLDAFEPHIHKSSLRRGEEQK